MYKLSAQNTDIYDVSYEITGTEFENAPMFVKTSSMLNKGEVESLPDDMFAMIAMTKTGGKVRKFPTIGPAHTWMSCKAFEKTASLMPSDAAIVAASNLKKSCSLYGLEVPDFVEKLAHNSISSNTFGLDEANAKTLAEEDIFKPVKLTKYAMTIDTKKGPVKMFKLDNKFNVESAIKYLSKNMKDMPIDKAREFATNVRNAAIKYGIKLPDEQINLIMDKKGTKAFVNIRSRTKVASSKDALDAINLLAVKSKHLSATKTASLLKKIDESIGFKKYSSRIKPPLESVIENWVKTAEESSINDQDKDGNIFKDDDIEQYASTKADELKDHLPFDLVEEFKMDPIETYKKMSDIQKKIVKNGMSGAL